MTHKNNLIPTPRTDKNGRTVIRHMKPNRLGASSSASIPAAVIGEEERARKLASASNVLREAYIAAKESNSLVNSDSVAKFVCKFEERLYSYSNATLDRIHNHHWSGEAATFINQDFNRDWNEATLNDYMMVSAAMGLTEGEGVSVIIVDSWVHYSGLHPANNDGDYPDERLSQLVALHHIVTYMDSETDEDVEYWLDMNAGELVLYLKDDALREFVLHPEEPYMREDIVAAVKNNAFDVGRIKEMISNDVASLGSGVL